LNNVSYQELGTLLYRAWRKQCTIDEMLQLLQRVDWTPFLQEAHKESELLKLRKSGDYEKFMTHVTNVGDCLVWTGKGTQGQRNRPLFWVEREGDIPAALWLFRYHHPDCPEDAKLTKICDTLNCVAPAHHKIKE
jgi:hypothetical protein